MRYNAWNYLRVIFFSKIGVFIHFCENYVKILITILSQNHHICNRFVTFLIFVHNLFIKFVGKNGKNGVFFNFILKKKFKNRKKVKNFTVFTVFTDKLFRGF